ncbi:hypothetical protein BKA58DRAFT_386602 [Alternaria rosae]|uniref:uncharacterized protein n=1 Tax=Alternaria rosae TaxID=1187941 RepID=UPI001E8EB289|nr:uncharacterized protein BKA58DRAFT_386602 [Alternaria rosae]KAH6868285.1 hypothetical protein BKA58DRAFT_386602 [Alternaria rosae]
MFASSFPVGLAVKAFTALPRLTLSSPFVYCRISEPNPLQRNTAVSIAALCFHRAFIKHRAPLRTFRNVNGRPRSRLKHDLASNWILVQG